MVTCRQLKNKNHWLLNLVLFLLLSTNPHTFTHVGTSPVGPGAPRPRPSGNPSGKANLDPHSLVLEVYTRQSKVQFQYQTFPPRV